MQQLTATACSYILERRTTSGEYASSLEKKVGELERLLSESIEGSSASQAVAKRASESEHTPTPNPSQGIIETMVDVPAHSQMTDSGESSESDGGGTNFGGLSLLRRLHNLCARVQGSSGDYLASESALPGSNISTAFDAAPDEFKPPILWEDFAMLPSRDTVSHAIETVVNRANCNVCFLDHNSLHSVAEESFQAVENGYIKASRKPLSLLFAVLALSKRFDAHENALGRMDDDEATSVRQVQYAKIALHNPQLILP